MELAHDYISIWLFFRRLRWLCWLSAIAYCIEFLNRKTSHYNSFGQLLMSSKLWLFGLPIAGVFAGFIELTVRERTGRPRPAIGRNWSY